MTSLSIPAHFSAAANPPAAGLETSRGESEQFLLQAFRSFVEAADSLERSYGMLRSEVVRLRGELEQSNAGLKHSLEENRQMRELDRILDGLPCGVLVAKFDGAISLVNPEGRRLLDLAQRTEKDDSFGSLSSVPGGLRDLLQRARSEPGEQEQCFADESGGERWLAVRHAAVFDAGKNGDDAPARADCVSIFILRDISDAKRLVEERDKLRREQAVAEMSAILAHEIRNPLEGARLSPSLRAGPRPHPSKNHKAGLVGPAFS